MKKSSIKNLFVFAGVVALGSYIVQKVVTSKSDYILDNEDEEILKNEKVKKFSFPKDRKYHTIYTKKNSTEE